MRILVVCQYYYPEPFRITDICESLVKRGHAVTVLTGLPNYPEGRVLDEYRQGKKRNEVINGVNIVRCYEIGRGNSNIKLFLNYISYALSATLKVKKLKDEYDIVLVNQLSPVLMGIPAMAYKRKFHKKILLYCLDLWPDSLAAGGIKEESFIYKVFYKISKWIYNSADTILITSSMFNDYFQNTLKIRDINIEHLPQYAEDIFINEGKNKTIKTRVYDKNNIYNFVFAGNIGDMQSVETIIKAASELREHSNIAFHIIGEGSKLADCKKLAKDLELKSIKFYGRRPLEDMPKFYEMADAMLITFKDNKTLSYTLPGKVQTYMAAGKPIIGSVNGETKLIIQEAKCGLYCEAENFKDLADLILKFCNSDDKEQMAENALKYYLENYSKEKFILKLENVIKKLEA